MRKTKRVMLLAFVIMISMVSCNNEELFVEPTQEAVIDEPVEVIEDVLEEPTVDASLPCDFDLSMASSGETIIINCMMDLNGQTINLPDNVTIVYDGGDIINGTLNFSDNSVISGELLNASITLGGASPQLKDTTFNFVPERWGIVEDVVSDAVALSNKTILQNLIDQSKLMGVDSFSIDKMDAYFLVGITSDVKGLSDNAIHLPTNFHLNMTENTFLRVQPNAFPFSVLMSVFEQENVTVSGGNLIGDRWEHDYTIIVNGTLNRSSHEWPVLLQVASSINVIVDGVYMADSTGDAFVPGNGRGHRYQEGVKFNKNVIARNCTMTRSRRNNISITDGQDIVIENCIITDCGIGEQPTDGAYNSNGVMPRAGIDIEPFIGGEDPNNLIYYARVERVHIKGCTFTGNSNASIIDYTGEDVVIENNFSDNLLHVSHGWRTKFINNTLVSSEANKDKTGIQTGTSDNYEVRGNSVSGFRVGIAGGGETGIVINNTIRDFGIGLVAGESNNYIFENNDIQGSQGVGISALYGKGNMIFKNNKILVDKSPVNFQFINNTEDTTNNTVVFDGNSFTARNTGGYVYINNSPNVTIKNGSITNATFLVRDSPNFVETNNTIN